MIIKKVYPTPGVNGIQGECKIKKRSKFEELGRRRAVSEAKVFYYEFTRRLLPFLWEIAFL